MPANLREESKRDKWDMNGCRWDAKRHDIREGNATERRSDDGIKGWVMLNLFLSAIYSIWLRSILTECKQLSINMRWDFCISVCHLKQIYCYGFINSKQYLDQNTARLILWHTLWVVVIGSLSLSQFRNTRVAVFVQLWAHWHWYEFYILQYFW